MNNILCALTFLVLLIQPVLAQDQEFHVDFEEYDLDNGLHVILHQNHDKARVHVNIMYHVGSRDDDPNRTGFAHFFEHLLFEGTKNIKKGEWKDITSSYGGQTNANTAEDRTFYINEYPSNALEVGLWMESERLLHPVIDETGVNEQRLIIKEEKKLRTDNAPYGNLIIEIKKHLFKKYPYHISTIGSIEHLNAAKLDEFLAYHKKFYVPNNAVLVIAGDFEVENAKKLVQDYFGSIPRGEDIIRNYPKEDPITTTRTATFYDPNINDPVYALTYVVPGGVSRESKVLTLISEYLVVGPTAKLRKKLIEDTKIAKDLRNLTNPWEAYGIFGLSFSPSDGKTFEEGKAIIDEELYKLQSELISEKDFELLMAKYLIGYKQPYPAEAASWGLPGAYLLWGNTNSINESEEIYKSITREEIKAVAKKYLSPNQRLELKYLPKTN